MNDTIAPFPVPSAIALLAALLVGLLAAPAALACMCAEPPPPAQALEQADAVFAGRVVAVERAERRTAVGALPRLRVTLELKSAWKGIGGRGGEDGSGGDAAEAGGGEGAGEAPGVPRTVQVWTGLGDGDCGFHFETGRSYLVYAHRGDDGSLSTDICTRTRTVDRAAEDLEVLGGG